MPAFAPRQRQSHLGDEVRPARPLRAAGGEVFECSNSFDPIAGNGHDRGVESKQGCGEFAIRLSQSDEAANGGGVAEVLRPFKTGRSLQNAAGHRYAIRMLDQIRERRHGADTQMVPILLDEGKTEVCKVDDPVNVAVLPRFERRDQMCAAGKGEPPRAGVCQKF